MFGKKILSIVGLLFMGSQMISLANALANDGDCGITFTHVEGGTDICETQNCSKGYYVVKNTESNENVYTIDGGKTAKYIKVNGSTCIEITAQESGVAGRFIDVNSPPYKFSLDGTNVLELGDGKKYIFTDRDSTFTGSDDKNVILKSTATSITVDYVSMNYLYNYCVDEAMVVWKRIAGLCNNDKVGDCTYYRCDGDKCTVENENLLQAVERNLDENCDLNEPDKDICVDNGYYIYLTDDTHKTPLRTIISGSGFTVVKCSSAGGWSCDEVSFIGYVANSAIDINKSEQDAHYIKCVKSDEGNICTPVATIDNNKLAIAVGKYLVSIGSEGLLGIAQESGNYVIVNRTADSAVVSTVSSDGYLTTTSSSLTIQNDSAGDLYKCTNESTFAKCARASETIGYLVNVGNTSNTPYIECKAAASCKAIQLGTCNNPEGADYGKLYKSNSNVSVCGVKNGSGDDLILSGASAIASESEYFASVGTQSLFGIEVQANFNIVLRFTDGNIVVDKAITNTPRYRYTLSNETLIHSRTSTPAIVEDNDICYTYDGATYPNAKEYILVNWTGKPDGLTQGIAYYVDENYSIDPLN